MLFEVIVTCLVALVFTITELKVYRWASKEFAQKEDCDSLEERCSELERHVAVLAALLED